MGERRTAVVTGGSRGIGRSIALKLAEQGYDVCIVYAGNAAAAEETIRLAQEIAESKREAKSVASEEIPMTSSLAGNAANADCPAGRVIAVQNDISTEEGARRAIETAEKELGHIDVLVNNAGITADGVMIGMKEEDFDRVLQVNLKGTFLCCKAVCRGMIRRRSGRIINLSSIVGMHGNAGQVNYAASKAGVIGLTKSLAKELASRGITVNAVAPGMIATDMTAALSDEQKANAAKNISMQRLGEPQDIANTALYLASDLSTYVTGQIIAVDGGIIM